MDAELKKKVDMAASYSIDNLTIGMKATDKRTITEVSKWGPNFFQEWRIRRLLKASYWSIHFLLTFFFNKVLSTLPKPSNGILYLIAVLQNIIEETCQSLG